MPRMLSRLGLTGRTAPPNGLLIRFHRTVRPTLPFFSVAPMTATDRGRNSGSSGGRLERRTSDAWSGASEVDVSRMAMVMVAVWQGSCLGRPRQGSVRGVTYGLNVKRDNVRMTKPGASELMRSLGLLVDGPVRWGAPIQSRAPGVFVVELPGGADAAPLDSAALRRWLERVPDLALDGHRPTVQQLSRRVAQDWLPDQPVLYVGRSTKSIGARLAGIYATPLGDLKPS